MTTAREMGDVRQGILATAQAIMAAKGFSAVGLNEILAAAGVPKGSFYHYFGSKDAFGEALLKNYFDNYLAGVDEIFATSSLTFADRLIAYFRQWQENQGALDCQGKCLAVKLGAEVADLSEAMRAVLKNGTAGIIGRLTEAIENGIADGSLTISEDPRSLAETLYHLWLGASLRAKIVRSTQPFDSAMVATQRLLDRRSS